MLTSTCFCGITDQDAWAAGCCAVDPGACNGGPVGGGGGGGGGAAAAEAGAGGGGGCTGCGSTGGAGIATGGVEPRWICGAHAGTGTAPGQSVSNGEAAIVDADRSEEHTSELQSPMY